MQRGIILAAGKGTRMESDLPKVLHKVAGKEMVLHVIDAMKNAGIKDIYVVVGYKSELVAKILPKDVKVVMQKEQLGTGHAVAMAKKALDKKDGNTIIVSGDTPLISPSTIKKAMKLKADGTVLTMELADPKSYGRIIKNKDNIQKIVEFKDANDSQKAINEVNSGIYVFNNKELFKYINKISNKNNQNEYYLTDIIELFLQNKLTVKTLAINPNEALGVNNKEDLMEVERIMKNQTNSSLASKGVKIIDSTSVYIESSVKFGKNVTIYPNVVIMGKTVIGDNTTIYPFTFIKDSTTKNDVEIGPFARLRDNALIEENAKVGNFVEVKNSTVGKESKAMHHAYLGDTKIGKKSNIGAGTITANYDGKNKHKTTIGDNVFIGSNSTLIAPVKVGKGALVAAGSTITNDVPANTKAFARSKQTNKK